MDPKSCGLDYCYWGSEGVGRSMKVVYAAISNESCCLKMPHHSVQYARWYFAARSLQRWESDSHPRQA